MSPDEAAAAGPLPVLQLVDTAGCGFEEAQEAEGSSYANPGEAKVGLRAEAGGERVVDGATGAVGRVGKPPQPDAGGLHANSTVAQCPNIPRFH